MGFFDKYLEQLTQQLKSLMGGPAQARYNDGTYEARTSPFSITVTGRKPKKKYKWVSARTPQLTVGDAMKGVEAATGPLLHWAQPSQYVGAIRDAVNKGDNFFDAIGQGALSMLKGNSGVVSEEYAQEHPWISTALNLGTDAFILSNIGRAGSAVNRGVDKAVTAWNQRGFNTSNIPIGLLSREPLIARGDGYEIARYPGYLLKGLMGGSPLEKQLSKTGTISINLLNAYFNKASQLEREVTNKVLTEKFAGLKTIDYNLFKKAILNELIGSYNRVPLTKWSDYGIDRLGYGLDNIFNLIRNVPELSERFFITRSRAGFPMIISREYPFSEVSGKEIRENFSYLFPKPPKLNTFTFESPRIPYGNNKHYEGNPLGHSRTYTLSEDPQNLYVIESQSDLAQAGGVVRQGNTRITPDMMEEVMGPEGPELLLTSEGRRILAKENPAPILEQHLIKNYLQRLLQENLRFAAESGLTRMSYPTPETAAKIEGYTLEPSLAFIELEKRIKDLKTAKPEPKYNSFEDFMKALREGKASIVETPEERLANLEKTIKNRDLIELLENEKALLIKSGKHLSYLPQHQTILKKYADFPKLFLKLYKGLNVRTVTDAKGNTWYEVDVPENYLNLEWLFKKGGQLIPRNIITQFKNESNLKLNNSF